MQLAKLGLIALMTLGLSSCKTEDVPDHMPYLLNPNAQGLCPRYKLTDKVGLLYSFESWAPCTDVNGGYGFRPGEAEKLIQYIRDEKAACDAAMNPPK